MVASVVAAVDVVFNVTAVVAWAVRSAIPWLERLVMRDVVSVLFRVVVLSCFF